MISSDDLFVWHLARQVEEVGVLKWSDFKEGFIKFLEKLLGCWEDKGVIMKAFGASWEELRG